MKTDLGLPELSLQRIRRDLDARTIDAVLAASPSAARRIASTLLPLGHCRAIAIGRPTAEEAAALGLPAPTPDGIVAALAAVFANEGNN